MLLIYYNYKSCYFKWEKATNNFRSNKYRRKKRSVNDFVSFQAAYHQCEIQLVSLSQLYKQEIQFKHN